jgi:hypothetical protein
LRSGHVLAIAAVMFVAAGCGGPSPDERFAEEACATTLERAQQLAEVHDDVVHTRAAPGADARAQMLDLAFDGQEITMRLRSEITRLAVPDTDAARDAVGYLESFARSAFESMVGAERDLRKVPEQMTLLQSINSLEQLEFHLIHALIQLTTGPDFIAREVADLEDPFKSADACKELAALRID